jgi:hypothetical protein
MMSSAATVPFTRLADEVRGVAVKFCAGHCTQSEFVDALLNLEEEKLRPNGLTLVVSHTIDEWITVLLKEDGTGQLCAAFEFMPAEHTFRRFGHLEEYPRSAFQRG